MNDVVDCRTGGSKMGLCYLTVAGDPLRAAMSGSWSNVTAADVPLSPVKPPPNTDVTYNNNDHPPPPPIEHRCQRRRRCFGARSSLRYQLSEGRHGVDGTFRCDDGRLGFHRPTSLRRRVANALAAASPTATSSSATSSSPRPHKMQVTYLTEENGLASPSGSWSNVTAPHELPPSPLAAVQTVHPARAEALYALQAHSEAEQRVTAAAAGRRNECQQCQRMFSFKSSLLYHFHLEHGVDGISRCDDCRLGFYRRSDLRKHIVTVHEKYRPFPCERCRASFYLRKDLNKHVSSVHEKLKPFACRTCGCKFGKKEHLTRHRRGVHERPSL